MLKILFMCHNMGDWNKEYQQVYFFVLYAVFLFIL